MSNECTEISALCPVEDTIYGYYPSLGANVFFVAVFGICLIAQLGLGIKYKTWTYMTALLLASASEAIGYVGRVMLHSNPWDNNGFIIQICCIIIGPAFNSAAIYLTLKHIVLTFGPQWSRLKPTFYTYIFIACDLISLVLQAVGGAMASTADENRDQLEKGDNLAMAGISWQVATLFFFALMTGEFIFRRVRAAKASPLSSSARNTLHSTGFRFFAISMLTAFVAIFIRCVYRIVEFAGGWQNPIMQDEGSYIALEGVMILIATLAQTVAHPGIFFPQLSSGYKHDGTAGTTQEKSGYTSSGSGDLA